MPRNMRKILIRAIYTLGVLSFVSFLLMPAYVAFANPVDAVPPSADGSVSIPNSSVSNGDREPDDNSVGLQEDDKVRDEQGRVSQLSTNTHNPYNGQIRLDIDIGSEFADFAGADYTEGYRLKVSPGGMVSLPKIKARDGYYFVGWGQGGVPYEPTWDPFTEEVQMDTDTSNGRNTTIFALFADEEGNGYCTCGAYESEVYADKMDEIKAINDEYNEMNATTETSSLRFTLCMFAVCVICLLVALYFDIRHADKLPKKDNNLDTESDA